MGLVLMGRAMLSKSLIQFSADGWDCVPSLYLGLRPNYVRGNGDLLQKDLCQDAVAPMTVVVSARDYAVGHCQPTPVLEAPGHSAANLAQSLVGSLFLSPGFWCTQGLVCAKSLFPQSCGSSVIKSCWPPKSNSLGVLSPLGRSPG